MPGYTKMERRRVTEWKGDAIGKTVHVRFEWFEIGTTPEPYQLENDEMWVSTIDCHFGSTKPG